MFILFLVVSLISSINAASIVSRSQSYPLSQPAVHGPTTQLTIRNKVISPDGFSRSAIVVNDKSPGHLITGQKGDLFNIEVVNQLSEKSMFLLTGVHWHGINQYKTNHYDGAPGITQCPITPDHRFTYSFSAQNQTGTFWYHSHHSVQYCDGLRGPLIIYDPEDPSAYLYDVDDASTVITLTDWYHTVARNLLHTTPRSANSTLINGLGRYAGGPQSDLAVINVTQEKRYRFRLIQMSCDANIKFSIDGHNLTIIEADGELTKPLMVDQLQILAGQRYSVVLEANQSVDNYWIRGIPNNDQTYNGVAILRYHGAPKAEPTTLDTPSTKPLQETDLRARIDHNVPGIPEYGKADINITLEVSFNETEFQFHVNDTAFQPPDKPVLSQILEGTDPSQLQPQKSVYVLEANKVVELTMKMKMKNAPGGPHPIHLHGHPFDVIQSAGSKITNYVNSVRRDVVGIGCDDAVAECDEDQTVIRWFTDNSGPWSLHCHIDFHLEEGFAVVLAESPQDTPAHVSPVPGEWNRLCPIYEEYKRTHPDGI
ncbi:laccase [Suillus plorans]|uniref:Laccase n=1 Tax=Suillus plorans TaxID=116603 RepID=A0A9P7AD52_9AGAM|nr:laccase [Suillus plorans]KAG1785906.1 laccase [Suillus plorans]